MKDTPILSLAYFGDAVIELLVREHLMGLGSYPPGELVKRSKRFVTCEAQSDAAEAIMPVLNEEELTLFKRGRNAKSHSTPKHGELIQYRRATGFEALFGYLYLEGNEKRAKELFSIAFSLSDELGVENTTSVAQ